MKEQLSTLKESTIKIIKLREKLLKQIIFFNLKVEEKKIN